MSRAYFERTFHSLQLPVVVCENVSGYPLIFINNSAKILLNPHQSMEALSKKKSVGGLGDILRFDRLEEFHNILSVVQSLGAIDKHKANIYSFEGDLIPVYISANNVVIMDEDFFVFYISEIYRDESLSTIEANNILTMVFHAAYHSVNIDNAINAILGLVGTYVNVSRAYIFEEISSTMTRNTYEWCNTNIEPAIQNLQSLKKEDYNYDVIVNGGLYIAEDVQTLPDEDREILEAQNIQSLLILPLFHMEKPIGYIGFDDCARCRKWRSNEMLLLKNVSNLIVTLIVRRNAELQAGRSLDILQTISDNLDNIIYVNDINTYEIIFINKTLAGTLQKEPEELIGKICWQVLQKDQEGPCQFCPIPRMLDENGHPLMEVYNWEFQNTITEKWYLVRDSIIKWIDSRYVHIETGTEITHRKQYEEQLKYYASTDIMTNTYNREWGYKLMRDMISVPYFQNRHITLCFVDLDGLKHVNDTYGHDAGDEMILQIVDALRGSIRQSDVICRWGGDEFILLLQCDMDTAGQVIQKVYSHLDKINASGRYPYKLDFSYGVTSLDGRDAASLDFLISHADKLMYQHKVEKRRNR